MPPPLPRQTGVMSTNDSRSPAKLDAIIDMLYRYTDTVFFKLNPTTGQPLYIQLMQQIRHATETGALLDGDQLPGIRTLAEELILSPHTVAKAYSELEHQGLLELRQGTGAFINVKRRTKSLTDHVHLARRRLRDLIDRLRGEGLLDEEIKRAFEAELLYPAETVRRR